jgi:hypothetical protein
MVIVPLQTAGAFLMLVILRKDKNGVRSWGKAKRPAWGRFVEKKL